MVKLCAVRHAQVHNILQRGTAAKAIQHVGDQGVGRETIRRQLRTKPTNKRWCVTKDALVQQQQRLQEEIPRVDTNETGIQPRTRTWRAVLYHGSTDVEPRKNIMSK